MKTKVFTYIIVGSSLIISCNKIYVTNKSKLPNLYVPSVRSPQPLRIEQPKVEIKYTNIKIKVLEKYQKETYNKMYNNPFNRNDGLTFSNWDDMYDKIMEEYEISPEDSEKMKEFKKMNEELHKKLRESGLTEKQIRKFYVLNYLQSQTSD